MRSLLKIATNLCIGQAGHGLGACLGEHSRCVGGRKIYGSSIAGHCWSAEHGFGFHQAKIVFEPGCISELDFLGSIAVHLSHEVVMGERVDSVMLSTVWKGSFGAGDHSSLDSND